MNKRLFDIFFSLSSLILISPLLLIISIVIKITSKGPIIFKQERVGKGGIKFIIYKFRTMHDTKSSEIKITTLKDKRITATGKFLRAFKVDELPQLINVLKGDMSIIGPRPEVPKYVEMYPMILREKILSVRPGLSDPSSLHFRNESKLLQVQSDPEKYYINVLIPKKLKISINYIERSNLYHDFCVILKTIHSIFK